MKILTTGNPNYGLAKAIQETMGGDFVSRSTGHDLCDDQVRQQVAQMSLDYDVFINCAALWRFHQSLVLETVWNAWKEAGKKGRIVNIGSTADTGVRGTSWRYPIEKKALKEYSRNMTYAAIGGSGIHVTYVTYGYISTPNVEGKHPDKKKIDPQYAAEMIRWAITQPEHININEISIDPIQA